MENQLDIFDQFYKNKTVLITGHTGFKGSWLSIWLHALGAKVIGYALDPYTEKDNFVLSGIGNKMIDLRGDITHPEKLAKVFDNYQPEIVFHLAAQPLVRLSYEIPVATYQTNVMGTIHVLECIRQSKSVKTAVMITSDKCYENKEQIWPYRETDALGGHDPYSSSKGAAEIAINSWRSSYFNPKDYDKHQKSIASVRAGNVIGGGDWALDRIIPDCVRAIEQGKNIEIRSPKAIRPWEHVLEPINGYLLLAKKMTENPTEYAQAYNFGPKSDAIKTVWEMTQQVVKNFELDQHVIKDVSDQKNVHEAKLLSLDVTKAKVELGWESRLNFEQTIQLTTDWYQKYKTENVHELCLKQIKKFINTNK